MTDAVIRLKPGLQSLSGPERAELTSFLLHSLDEGEDSGVEAAWEAELKRRSAEIDSGRAVTVSAAQVFVELGEKYGWRSERRGHGES